MDISYQVMVYDSTKNAYEQFMKALPTLFEVFGCDEEFPSDEMLSEIADHCKDTFFLGEMLPPYDERDIINILRYYAQEETAPTFYTFEDIDRNKIDVCVIAKEIVDRDMTQSQKTEYVNKLWNDGDDNLLRLFFFGRLKYFYDQLDREIIRLTNPMIFEDEDNVKYGKRSYEDMTLIEIRKVDPDYEKQLRNGVFEAAKKSNGKYVCACCKQEFNNGIYLQVDHIIPMNKGGKTVPENLQILCRKCNGEKGDK